MPLWFTDRLQIPKKSAVICIDDSISVLNGWKERIWSIDESIELHYFATKKDFLSSINAIRMKKCTYLIDYEFSGENYTGKSIIEDVLKVNQNNNRVILVTSRSGEEDIQTYCVNKEIKIIPKTFISEIPIEIVH